MKELQMIPEEKVLVDLSEMPDYQVDQMCRTVISFVKRIFKDPEVQADYQRWLAEREKEYGNEVGKEAERMG